MGDVIHCTFTPKTTDGGKARIMRRREQRQAFRLDDTPTIDTAMCDLTMGCRDPEDIGASA
jgi:hypothetical protein